MKTPVVAKKTPKLITLQPGTHYWCSCGQSKNQPFCDGSHQGGEFVPLPLHIRDKADVALCQCKHSSNKPFCDGSHKDL